MEKPQKVVFLQGSIRDYGRTDRQCLHDGRSWGPILLHGHYKYIGLTTEGV